MKMLADTVLVMEHKGRDASDGGIILPEGSKQRTYQGSVIAVGPGKPLPDGGRYPMSVRVNDVIAYPERTGDKVTIEGQEMLAIPEQYIICVLIEADPKDLSPGDEANMRAEEN
jgi:chaperonin GroES